MKQQELIEKLVAFRDAANELSEAWTNSDVHDPLDCRNYPFHRSFDEMVYDIDTWIDDNIEKQSVINKASDYLKSLDLDGEALEHILRNIGMDDQIFKQLLNKNYEKFIE